MALFTKKEDKEVVEITKDGLKAFAEKHTTKLSEEIAKLKADNAKMAAEIEAAALEKDLNHKPGVSSEEDSLDTLYNETFGKGK